MVVPTCTVFMTFYLQTVVVVETDKADKADKLDKAMPHLNPYM